MQDRQDDVHLAEPGRSRGGLRGNGQRLGHGSRGQRAVRAGDELPASVAADPDRDRVVAVGVERLEHRAAGGERDRMLARAPAHQDRDAQAWALAHGDVVVVVVVVVVCLKWPTKIVTDAPGLACAFGAGSWSSTMPSWLGSFVCCRITFTLKPDCLRIDAADGDSLFIR